MSRPESGSSNRQCFQRRSSYEERRENAVDTNSGRYNEAIDCNGNETAGVPTPSDELATSHSATHEPCSTATKLPDPAPMGKPKPVDPNSVLNPVQNKPPAQNSQVRICSWNIRRGLVIREPELKQMISTYSLNIIFLVETDTCAVNEENDYRIPGFKTLVQNKKDTTSPTRIISLVDERMKNMTTI